MCVQRAHFCLSDKLPHLLCTPRGPAALAMRLYHAYLYMALVHAPDCWAAGTTSSGPTDRVLLTPEPLGLWCRGSQAGRSPLVEVPAGRVPPRSHVPVVGDLFDSRQADPTAGEQSRPLLTSVHLVQVCKALRFCRLSAHVLLGIDGRRAGQPSA